MRRQQPMAEILREALQAYLRREPRQQPPDRGEFRSGRTRGLWQGLMAVILDKARATLHRALSEGHYFVADVPREPYPRIAAIDRQYADLELGFVDSAIIVIAESLGLSRIATTDRRDFTPLQKDFSITLLP